MASVRSAAVHLFACLSACAVLGGCGSDPVDVRVCPTAPPPSQTLRLTVQSLTSGTPPVSVNPMAARGTLNVTVNVGADMIPSAGARLELRSGTQVLASAPVPNAGGAGLVSIPLTIDTNARDAAGARVVPNGAQTWEVVLLAGATEVAGCAPVPIGSITFPLSVTNP